MRIKISCLSLLCLFYSCKKDNPLNTLADKISGTYYTTEICMYESNGTSYFDTVYIVPLVVSSVKGNNLSVNGQQLNFDDSLGNKNYHFSNQGSEFQIDSNLTTISYTTGGGLTNDSGCVYTGTKVNPLKNIVSQIVGTYTTTKVCSPVGSPFVADTIGQNLPLVVASINDTVLIIDGLQLHFTVNYTSIHYSYMFYGGGYVASFDSKFLNINYSDGFSYYYGGGCTYTGSK